MPSSSKINVSVSAQISSSRCQSAELRQTRDFQAQYNTGPSHAGFADELLKPFAVYSRSARLAQIGIDDDDLVLPPSQRDGTLAQGILALGAFGILDDLPHGRLTDLEVGVALEVRCSDLLVSFGVHE